MMDYKKLWFNLKKDLVHIRVTNSVDTDRKVLAHMSRLEFEMFESFREDNTDENDNA